MRFEILAPLLISLFCIIGFFRNYKITKQRTNFFYKYIDLFFVLQWILIALMNYVNSLIIIPITIIFIIIQIKVSKAIRSNNKKNEI